MLANKLSEEPITKESELKIVDALSTAKDELKRTLKPDYRKGAKILLWGAAVAAFSTVVREVDRQRKELEKQSVELKEIRCDYEAVIAYTKTLIEETNCGKSAYVHVQMLAEEETGQHDETVASWTTEDNVPIPYFVSE